MTESPSDLIAAARHLAQWGRSRQAVWQDASSDLLAALGNRYASFDDLQSALPPPPPLPPRPQAVAPPPVFTPAPEPMPIVAAPPPLAPPAPLPLPVPVPRVATPVRNQAASVGSPLARPTRPRVSRGFLALAALVVVAALASPALWKAYEATRVVAPTTNTLTIESTPPGSIVLIDGVESGKTPLSTSLIVGVHHVELRYRKNVRTLDVEVVAGDPIVTRVDWTKRAATPAGSKKRPAAKTADSGGAAGAAKPSAPVAPAAADRASAAPSGVTTPPSPAMGDDDRDAVEPDAAPGEPHPAPVAERP